MSHPYPPTPPPGAGHRPAPKWARKRVILPALGVAFIFGAVITSAGDTTATNDAKPAAASPGPTVTVTATADPSAEPAPTVTKTVKATTTVRATVTVTAGSGGSADDNSDSGSGGGSVYYANCSEARAAGAAPVHRGDPGYAGHLDRDGDGIGCDS
ncbi:excalibur calcium-binding domain-containing protein [Streptomyces sp. YC504]|uniref:Excalibur calcium-binding domain-containing protein n=1 Tax=Streptomyces mesophilus TaxID=1775132 RepID=A0A6G4XPL2_9ACTN|nr:excalibur calcium-binding domain-containing protein [Streptomyces mesophilus]NGO78740.1 excalibur calcium-binding domain-containing protein [Streptomyces mesophilus]